MSSLHRKELGLTFGECLANGDSAALAAKCCATVVNSGCRWRQRFLAWIGTDIEN